MRITIHERYSTFSIVVRLEMAEGNDRDRLKLSTLSNATQQ